MRVFVSKYSIEIICLFIFLNFALSITALVKSNACSKIYTIGVNRLTGSFTKDLNSASLSSEQQSMQVINFAKGLESALAEFQAQGKVLLMEEAVLSGGADITGQVVNRIKKGMNKHD